jgi:hypothetical protein
MNTTGSFILTVSVVTVVFFAVLYLVRLYSKYSGMRVATCPETGKPTAVKVDAVHAALTAAARHTDLRLQACERWPGKENCGQECLASLDVAPEHCLVNSVLMKWYRGKSCVYCGMQFGKVHWIDHKPALQSPEGALVGWDDIQIENLPAVLDSHLPICWDCHIAQSFLRENPDLVVYRPWRNAA